MCMALTWARMTFNAFRNEIENHTAIETVRIQFQIFIVSFISNVLQLQRKWTINANSQLMYFYVSAEQTEQLK